MNHITLVSVMTGASRKKFIQARPASGSLLVLPQAKPMKIRPK
jgi:hypothetical protein